MYPFDAPFWQKMFFVGVVVGVSLFVNFFIDACHQASKDFKIWKENYFKNEYPKVKSETNRIVKDMKNKIFGKVMCLAIMGMFIMCGIIITIPHNVNSTTNTSYPLQDYVSIWQRKNTWIGEGTDGQPDPIASNSMNFFGTNNLILSDMLNPHGYSWAEVANPAIIPTYSTLVIQLGLGNVSNAISIATDIANHAKTDSRIIGIEWDDFRVGQESPANMTAIYNAVHHEDANLSQGNLKLGLVVYTFNYFKETPYSWSDIENYFDIINYWFSPSDATYYFSEYGERNGYYDSFRELSNWMPTKEYKLGVYLHLWNAGAGNKEYAYSGQLEQLLFGARLIREGYASGWTILENTFITSPIGIGVNSANLVRDFLFYEFLPNYSSTITQSTLSSTSTIIRNIVYDPVTSGFKFFSTNFQWVDVYSSWTSPNVQNIITGEFAELGILSGKFTFLADTGSEYRVYNRTYSAITYTNNVYINTSTTWDSKVILFEANLYVNSTFHIHNCIIRFADYQHNNTLANETKPHYGFFLNYSGDAKIDNTTFEPENRMFPYLFDLTGNADTGYSKEFYSHNSTFACYAGDLRAYGYFKMYDSFIYMPTDDGSTNYGVSLLGPTFTQIIVFERNIVTLPQVKDARFVIQPSNIMSFNNNIIIGAGGYYDPLYGYNDSAFKLMTANSAGQIFHNITLAPMTLNEFGLDNVTLHHRAWSEFEGQNQDWGNFDMTRNFILKSYDITSFSGILRNANGDTIASLSTTNGTIIYEVSYLRHTNVTTIHNPFPWNFQITGGLNPGYIYKLRDDSYWNGGYNQFIGTRTIDIINDTITINYGQNIGLIIEGTPAPNFMNEHPIYGMLALVFIFVCAISMALIFIKYKEALTIEGVIIIIVAFSVGMILVVLGTITFWSW